jgi:hypothetical protein
MTDNKMTDSKHKLAFGKENYYLMLLGLGILIIGFIIMSSGDYQNFGFDFMGLTLGALTVFVGFMFQFFAILYKPKKKAS